MPFKPFLLSSVALCALCLSHPALAQKPQDLAGAAITNIEMRLSAVEDQMRALTGKVEQNDYYLRRIDQAIQRLQTDYDERLTHLEQTPRPAPARQEAPTSTAPDDAGSPVSGSLGGVKIRDGQVTGAVSDPKAPPLPDTPADYGLTAQEAYDRAFGLLRQADYEEAETSLKNFIDKFPEDKLTGNAKYWYAETFYVRGSFGDAAVAFAEAYQHDPNGTKAPDSLLKLALSLAGLDKKKDACDTLLALKSKYPKASDAIKDRTKQEQARLKCK